MKPYRNVRGIMKAYKVTGTFKMGSNEKQKFEKEVMSESENAAKEKVLSLLGSKHRVKRMLVKIDNVKELKANEATDPLVKSAMHK